MRYLLDTDTCIYALRQHERVIHRLLAAARADVAVSVITEAELRTGAAKSSLSSQNAAASGAFSESPRSHRVHVGRCDRLRSTARQARASRKPIGPLDTLIAAQAIARKLVLISNNEREFRRVPALTVENWSR